MTNEAREKMVMSVALAIAGIERHEAEAKGVSLSAYVSALKAMSAIEAHGGWAPEGFWIAPSEEMEFLRQCWIVWEDSIGQGEEDHKWCEFLQKYAFPEEMTPEYFSAYWRQRMMGAVDNLFRSAARNASKGV